LNEKAQSLISHLADGSECRRSGMVVLATVVGPDGSTSAQGAQEVHTDRFGRVRIRYEFQGGSDSARGTSLASPWVGVMQPLAGAGQGVQWTPRIGHEVLVGHFDDDIEQPLVLCSLYHGKGEGGVPATPGGTSAEADLSVFASSSDASASGQGNLSGGNSPAWHGAAPGELAQGGQRNAAALSGYKSKEFGGSGFNQLVFDDSNQQLRVQLASSQHASQLNLGHLIHQADNHRGSFRGTGWELRTDAYGSVRASRGLLITSFSTSQGEPAGDNAAGIALAKQLNTLGQALSQAATTHQTVALSGQIGTQAASQSALASDKAPLAAWLQQVSTQVSDSDLGEAQSDAAQKNTTAGSEGSTKVPSGSDPVIALSARGGLLQTAAQDIILAAQENIQLASSQDQELASGGALRIHTGQAIGILGGAIEPGTQPPASE
jgi:type VI secretion system secreted protein VgrG